MGDYLGMFYRVSELGKKKERGITIRIFFPDNEGYGVYDF